VPHAEDSHAFVSVVNLADYPVVADPDAPVVPQAGSFMAAGRTWIFGKCLDTGNDAIKDIARQRLQVAFSGPLN
jgi:hypothetical protein